MIHSIAEGKEACFGLIVVPNGAHPFELVDGPNTWYGQLHKPILAHPFKEAGIKWFTPISPFKVTANFLTPTDQDLVFQWSSLLELNDDLVLSPSLLEG